MPGAGGGGLTSGRRTPFLRIADEGWGLRPKGRSKPESAGGYHIGIEGMKERMANIGGTLEWRAGEKGGVTVEAHLAPRA